MPQINILNVLQGDNQSTIVDKINYNFDQILSSGGGPQGARGLIGSTGPVGPQGAQGTQGLQGPSGSKWFVQETSPASGGVTASNPWNYPSLGDYWMDPDSLSQSIYVYTATGWVDTGYGLASGSLFQKVTPIDIIGSATGQAILIAGATASDKSIVFSDATTSSYTPGGTAIDNLNYENSKLKIATKDSRTRLLSFSRSDYDTSPGGSGYLSHSNNPYFGWNLSANPSGASGTTVPGFYDINFTNPKGSIGIVSIGTTTETGINMLSSSEITAVADDNILLQVNSVNKGTFISTPNATAGGFFELSSQGSSGSTSNLPGAAIFANSLGVGLGLGTGQFKQSGIDARRLAINGNTSISNTSANHTTDLFVGATSSGNFNKGAIFVEGQGAFGATGPTFGYTNGVTTPWASTGAAEALDRFPQAWITSRDPGPVLQIRSLGQRNSKGSAVLPRTVIGDGSTEYNLDPRAITERPAGQFTDISQIAEFINPADASATGPAFSYQHKLRSSGITSAAEPIFALTTHINTSISGTKTVIQTLNSNPDLHIFANSTGNADSNRVLIGARSSIPYIGVIGGTAGSANYGNVAIGASADSYTKQNGQLASTFQNLATLNGNKSMSIPNHALTITGTQTIGTTDPVSAFNRTSDPNNNAGSNSMLKIHRNLFSGTSIAGYKGSSTLNATGYAINNYPNGLEITSYKPPSGLPNPLAPSSVALAIGSTSLLNITEDFVTYYPSIPATGFFVSDDGTNVGVGQYIDTTAAIGVSGAGSDFAIKAKGNVGITGAVGVTGNIRSSGIVRADVDFTTGTDTPGWTDVVLTLSDIAYGAGTTPYANVTVLAGAKSLTYKIIGKTVHVHFYISSANSPVGDTSRFYIKLPSAIHPNLPSNRFTGMGYYTNNAGYAYTGIGTTLPIGRCATIITTGSQSDIGGTAPTGYYLLIDTATWNNMDTQASNPITLRGSITYELN